MAKTQVTTDIEKALLRQTAKMRIFGCLEVTIGWGGKERVDYMTLDFKGKWRCYEIKVSKTDFYSKASKTFVGHLNYYVMPQELYEQVKQDIPEHIGVKYVDCYGYIQSLKPAKSQGVTSEMDKKLSNSLIRCLCRDLSKLKRGAEI